MKRLALVAAIPLLLAAACSDGEDDPGPTQTAEVPTMQASPGSTPSVEPTQAPPAGPIANGYGATPVWPDINFERMVGLHFFPDDPGEAVVLTQMEGVIRRFSAASPGDVSVLLDLRDRMIDGPRNEEGLLGFAFAPDYATSGRIYVYYTAGDPRRSVIARYNVRDGVADPVSETIVLEIPQPAANHNGGALQFGPDGMLYIALGDGGGQPQNGQSLDTLLGKILRIDVSGDTYTVPPDNPFVGTGRGEIWSYGWRNPWRITFDRETGDLWAGDVGQGSWEEVNLVVRGGNYGWSITEGFECFGESDCDMDELIAPRAAYPTGEGCAITGGYVYRGEALPELEGWYVYADYCSGQVWALDTASQTSEPVTLIEGGDSIASFGEDAAGELYLVTFGEAIYRLDRAE